MKTILLLATTTGYQTRSFAEAANRLGMRLVFATDRCDRLEDPWWDQAVPIRFHDEPGAVRAIVQAVNGVPLAGILAVGDRPVPVASLAAAALGLPGNPPEAAHASRNKLAVRLALRAAGLPTPWFQPVPADRDPRSIAADVPYPCVLKPLALSGSRGVIRADTPGDFVAAFDRIVRLLNSPDVQIERDSAHGTIVIESFIPGREFAVEGLLDRGVFRPLAIFDKPDPLDGPFFEETIYVTPSLASAAEQGRILDAIAAAARALGLAHGPVHAECRANTDGVYVLEVAARPIGGLCSRALRFVDAGGAEVPFEELLLRHAAGEDVSGCARESRASGVMMVPIPKRGVFRGVEGVGDARGVPLVDDVRITAKPDALLVPLPEGKSYLGFIFARGETPEAVVQALRESHARLQFRVDRALI